MNADSLLDSAIDALSDAWAAAEDDLSSHDARIGAALQYARDAVRSLESAQALLAAEDYVGALPEDAP